MILFAMSNSVKLFVEWHNFVIVTGHQPTRRHDPSKKFDFSLGRIFTVEILLSVSTVIVPWLGT